MSGHISPGFEAVADLLESFRAEEPDYSAQLVAIHRGQPVLDITVGDHFGADDLIGVFSSSKGVAALALSLLIGSGDLVLDEPVSRYWPEFAAAGKADVTVRTALSHRAGLIGVAGGMSLQEIVDHDGLAARLAATLPLWAPGSAHGYHGSTIGVIIAELVTRVTGSTFQDFFRREVQKPLGVDFHFGVPGEVLPRVRDVLAPYPSDLQPSEPDPLSLAGIAQGSGGMPPILDQADHPVVRAGGPVSFGGVGNARSLARLYAAALGDDAFFPAAALATMSQIHSSGEDLVLGLPIRFGIVFQSPDTRLDYGSPWAFGHDGAGGSIGFADPPRQLAFGYVTRRFPSPPGADVRGIRACRVLRDCIRSAER